MLKLHVLQAEYGDCLLLEYGSSALQRFMLIDGGPPNTYERHLRPVLQQIGGASAKLDAAALSHVDNDHIVGLLDYFADLRAPGAPPDVPKPDVLWHNSFGRVIDPHGHLGARLQSLLTNTRAAAMPNAGEALTGISEGNSLRIAAAALQIPINNGFPEDLILVDTASSGVVFDNLTVRIVGPTRLNLQALQEEWEHWLDTHEAAIGTEDPVVMANADRSIPNLSSVMFLAEADGRTILFTGDGRSDHLLQGLGQAGLLDGSGRIHVDVLKLPHHGSNRNATRTFFRKVTAATYVASANGKNDNPDLATLIWIVEAAHDAERQIRIVATNRTPSIEKLVQEYDPAEYGYEIDIMAPGAHSVALELA